MTTYCMRNNSKTKVSALDPSNTEYIGLHKKPIRDIKFSPMDDGLILTASLDKSLLLTNTKTNNIVLR